MAPTITKTATLTVTYDATERGWAILADGVPVRWYHTEADVAAMVAYYRREQQA